MAKSPLTAFCFLSYKTNIFHVAMDLYSNESQKSGTLVRTSLSCDLFVTFFSSYHISTSSAIHY